MGFHLMNLSGASSTITALTNQNSLKYDSQNVAITNGAFQ